MALIYQEALLNGFHPCKLDLGGHERKISCELDVRLHEDSLFMNNEDYQPHNKNI
jgi:hypothetical protein